MKKKLKLSLWGIVPILAIIGLSGSAAQNDTTKNDSTNLTSNAEVLSCHTESAPYKTVRENTLELNRGAEQISVTGQDGEQEVCTKDGLEVSRKVTKQQVDQVILVGTKETPPTSYESSARGATAMCRDGTYSYSQSRRGTCSHHGGVAEWY